MTNKKAFKLFETIQKKMQKDGDKFLFVHFSRKEDHFRGMNHMDGLDALVVIKQLIERYSLSAETIAAMARADAKEFPYEDEFLTELHKRQMDKS